MPKCEHDIRESKRGAGRCDIRAEVKLRNGQPNWWCHTHGMAARAPDGNALETCPGSWLDPIPEEELLELDLGTDEISIWGALPPAVVIGDVYAEPGKVHVHRRRKLGAPKDIDRSFAMVTLHADEVELQIEGMAAVAYSVSELSGRVVVPLRCPHCGETHIDELKFATFPHAKHLCNSCGRNFRDSQPSVSNPLAEARATLRLPPRPASVRPNRPLDIRSADYSGISLMASNSAIISTAVRPEEEGIHVHAWDQDGEMSLDETYSSVSIDGQQIDEDLLRIFAVQRAVAHNGEPIVALQCDHCGAELRDGQDSYLEARTAHSCACGAITRTRLRSFVNPLARRFPVPANAR